MINTAMIQVFSKSWNSSFHANKNMIRVVINRENTNC